MKVRFLGILVIVALAIGFIAFSSSSSFAGDKNDEYLATLISESKDLVKIDKRLKELKKEYSRLLEAQRLTSVPYIDQQDIATRESLEQRRQREQVRSASLNFLYEEIDRVVAEMNSLEDEKDLIFDKLPILNWKNSYKKFASNSIDINEKAKIRQNHVDEMAKNAAELAETRASLNLPSTRPFAVPGLPDPEK